MLFIHSFIHSFTQTEAAGTQEERDNTHTCACAGPQSAAARNFWRCQRASLQRVQAHGAIQAGRHKPLGAHSQAGDHRGCAPALERLSEQALGCARGSGRLTRCGVLYRHYQGHGRVSRQGTSTDQHHAQGPACWCRTANHSLSSFCTPCQSWRGICGCRYRSRSWAQHMQAPSAAASHAGSAEAGAGALRPRAPRTRVTSSVWTTAPWSAAHTLMAPSRLPDTCERGAGIRYAQSGCTGAARRRACCPGTRAPARRRRGGAGGCRGSTVPEALSLNITPPRESRTCWPASAGHIARSTVRHRRIVKFLAVHPAMAPRRGGGGAAWPLAAAGRPARPGRRPRRGGRRGGAAHQEGQAGDRAQAGGEAGDAAGARARVPEQRAAAARRAQRAQVVHRHAARLVRARQQPPARQHLRARAQEGVSAAPARPHPPCAHPRPRLPSRLSLQSLRACARPPCNPLSHAGGGPKKNPLRHPPAAAQRLVRRRPPPAPAHPPPSRRPKVPAHCGRRGSGRQGGVPAAP